MRLRILGLAVVACSLATEARAQWAYPGAAPYRYGPVHAFRDESILSINNSYLGYGNLVDVRPNPPALGSGAIGDTAPAWHGFIAPPAPIPTPVWQTPRRFQRWTVFGH
jgi:hypothetical protein